LVPKVSKAYKVSKDLKEQGGQARKAFKVLPVLRDSKAHKVSKELKVQVVQAHNV
jgi:hypothetical protein